MNLILAKVRKLSRILTILNFLLILYTIFSDNGYLAVRDEKSGTVYRTDIRTESFPTSDRLRLQRGIVCEDEKELAAVIENYIS